MCLIQSQRFVRRSGFLKASNVISTCATLRGKHPHAKDKRQGAERSQSLYWESSSAWFDISSLEHLTRKELQKLCKQFAIRANRKTYKLKEDLEEFHKVHLSKQSSILHFPFIPSIKSNTLYERYTQNYPGVEKSAGMFAPLQAPLTCSSKREVGKLQHTTSSHHSCSRTCIDPLISGEAMGGLKYLSHEKTPSVTTILNSTKPLSLILKWRDKKKGELGEERFKKYQSEIRKRGTEFHSFIKNLSSGDGNAISDNINGSLASISSVLKDVTSVIATEKQVSHFSLGYSGYFDMLALFRGVPCIIEWKTSERPKPTLQDCYEYPLQVVAYAGAVNSSPYVSVPVTHCAVVIAYHDGSPAHVHALNLELCEKYWQKWLVKLFNYRQTNTILQ